MGNFSWVIFPWVIFRGWFFRGWFFRGWFFSWLVFPWVVFSWVIFFARAKDFVFGFLHGIASFFYPFYCVCLPRCLPQMHKTSKQNQQPQYVPYTRCRLQVYRFVSRSTSKRKITFELPFVRTCQGLRVHRFSKRAKIRIDFDTYSPPPHNTDPFLPCFSTITHSMSWENCSILSHGLKLFNRNIVASFLLRKTPPLTGENCLALTNGHSTHTEKKRTFKCIVFDGSHRKL